MLRLSNANAIVIQGLIAPKGLDCFRLQALDSWNLRISLKEEEEKKNTSP